MKLQSGKTYRNKWGDVVKILLGPIGNDCLFRDELGYSYKEDGVMARCDMDERFNLIAEN